MASKNTIILFLVLNLLLFSLANAKKKPPSSKPPSAMPPPSKPPSAMPPSSKPPSTMPPSSNCPIDAHKLKVCANVLDGLLGITTRTPPKRQCCSLIQGLADLDAAICLCTAIRANVLGINLDVPLSINLLLNACGSNYPDGFTCRN